ncbi:MAG: ATP-binding protein [Candidatus Nanopelagicales bacterium]
MKATDSATWEELPPDPASTIESLRHLGYQPRSAVADLIDNSLAWDAREVTIKAHWAGADSWVAIIDDGSGMTKSRLRDAMQIGSGDPLAPRGEGDLGRFGFGLKTASFSQAREVTVSTRTKDGAARTARCWDLDEVRRTGRWLVRKSAPELAEPILDDLDNGKRGTVVLWRRLTDLVDPKAEKKDSAARAVFYEELDVISRWLGMVFEHFLSRLDSVKMRVNQAAVNPFDPFLRDNLATQSLPLETLRLHKQSVLVAPYVLPHESKLNAAEQLSAGGPLGWNDQQGFYVYRRDRLIVAGDWLGLGLPRDDKHNLARIRIDIPAELDREWQLDVAKGTVRPPAALRADLLRIARETRKKAAAVKRHRAGEVIRNPTKKIEHVWRLEAVHDGKRPRINRTHPLIAKALDDAGPGRRDLASVLSLLEDSLPASALPSQSAESPPLADQTSDRVMELADMVYESMLAQGKTRSEAAQRICNTEPFYLYPQIVEHFGAIYG